MPLPFQNDQLPPIPLALTPNAVTNPGGTALNCAALAPVEAGLPAQVVQGECSASCHHSNDVQLPDVYRG